MNKKEVKPEKGEPSASEELAKFLKASIKKYLEEFGGSNQAIPIVVIPMKHSLRLYRNFLHLTIVSSSCRQTWKQSHSGLRNNTQKLWIPQGSNATLFRLSGKKASVTTPLYTLAISRLLIPKLLPRTSCLDQHLRIETQARPENPNPPTQKNHSKTSSSISKEQVLLRDPRALSAFDPTCLYVVNRYALGPGSY
ncbi:Protein of unknown function [Pyronema omphalodes CBS 100304]|uniref:Uncharacterized protein n=1 Tax=Pyronema omphalodes (strain CBS 100304) TaxID=1076935 RepID=U4KUU6_PYROM|nr:Protein of unknown function [Pyronema omphalodes CBS 100304]